MTGVTGTVMNPLCARLLKDGHTVVALVRSGKDVSPRERLLATLCVNEEARGRLFVLQGDITQELAGVSAEDQQHWVSKIEKVVHGAASIKFVETPDNQVFRANVSGTENTLCLAQQLGVPEFHYISTAYVCGDAKWFAEEDTGENQHHRNAYEASKARAEQMVRGFPGKFSIYRIPIVVGNSQTGEINSFSGYYGFLATFWQLRNSLLKRWERDLEACLKGGISLDGEGYLHVPLSIPCSQEGPLNLVPLDWLTEMFTVLVQQYAEGKTFHLTHPSPRGVRETMVASLAHMGFRGIACGAELQECRKPRNDLIGRIQRGIITNIGPYIPYTSKDREVFHNTIAVQALGLKWKQPPDMNSEVVGRFLRYAKKRNFGRS